MLSTVAITGTILVAGVSAYRYFAQEQPVIQQWRTYFARFTRRSAEPQPADSPVNIDPNPPTPSPPRAALLQWEAQHTDERLLAASISLSLATVGATFAPPIAYTCIPLLAYLTLHTAQDAYQVLVNERRLDYTVFESLLIGYNLAQGSYLVGSTLCVLYYSGRQLWSVRQRSLVSQPSLIKTLVGAAAFPSQVRVQRAGNEIEVPVATLQHGDIMVVRAGELIPMAGQISRGRAWVAMQNSSHNAETVIKRPGSRVAADQLVLAGLLYIVVQPAELS